MTLSLATVTSSGIVLTADSRQTYQNNAGMVRIGTDSVQKLFELNRRAGVVIAGRAFIDDEKSGAKNIGYYIDRFKRENKTDHLSIKEIAEKLNTYLSDLFVNKEINNLRGQIEADVKSKGGTNLVFKEQDDIFLPYEYKDVNETVVNQKGKIESIHMIVAGIDKDEVGRAYVVYAPKGIDVEQNTKECGAMWIGQTDVLRRIIKGYAREIQNLDFVKEAIKTDSTALSQLTGLEYIVNWGTITLQDAIDFCILITRTTESIQRFSDGTSLFPGGITGVGGDVDVAVITPEHGFVWIKKKELTAEGKNVDLDQQPELTNK